MITSYDTKNGKITIHIFVDVHIDIKQEQQVSLKISTAEAASFIPLY